MFGYIVNTLAMDHCGGLHFLLVQKNVAKNIFVHASYGG